MTFEETIRELPFSPSTEEGRGLLPVLGRSLGHFLYLLGRLSDTPTRRPTDLQIKEEIDAIKLHLDNLVVPEYLSNQAQRYMGAFRGSFQALQDEIESWEYDTKINNIRLITNRTAQLFAFLDRETLGLRDSDAGQNL